MTANIDLTKQSVRKLIKDLMEQVPVPPTTTTAGKARQWFGAQGGVRPVAVKNWLRQNLTQESLYSGGTVTLTWYNANVFCEEIDDSLDEFLAGPTPTEEPDVSAHAWLPAADSPFFTDPFIDWFDAEIILSIVVEI